MWHEARKQEKKIRGMMVDYRKRAERRRDFYEKFKADPTQFLQLHGRPCKIHLDPAIAVAGDSTSVMMPWQGHPEVLIDRFDVRAHLDVIADPPFQTVPQELNYEERTINYERYRILVQNEFLGVNEEKFLHQIYLEEQFGPIALKHQDKELSEKEKRKKGAAIGYQYEDSTTHSHTTDHLTAGSGSSKARSSNDDAKSDSEDSDVDFDLCLDLSQIDNSSAHDMNKVGQRYGLQGNDFYSLLTNDVEEQEAMRLARQQEEEKAMFSGRKARRERQAFREKKLIGRVMSPPSYAARKSPTYIYKRSASRSVSPDNTGQITYITSFGDGDESNEDAKRSKSHSSAQKGSRKRGHHSMSGPVDKPSRRAPPSKPTSLASSLKQLLNKRKGRSRSRSPSRNRSRSRSMIRSRSRSRTKSRSRSWSSSSSRTSRSKVSRSTRSRSRSMSSMTSSSSSSSSKRSRSNSKQTSNSKAAQAAVKVEANKTALPRYYGRNRKSSTSSLELASSDSESNSASQTQRRDQPDNQKEGLECRRVGNAKAASKGPKETPQEKLKKKMQAMLNRQFRLDKKAEKERLEKAERERADREAELRDMAIKMRRRERYMRHMNEEETEEGMGHLSDISRDSSQGSGERRRRRSRSRSRSPSRSRSRSRSPPPKHPRRTLVDY